MAFARSMVTFAFAFALGALSGCGGTGPYTWVHELPPNEIQPAAQAEYVIREGDSIRVIVFNQEPLSTKAKVRADGRIGMPAIGDVEVRGKTPSVVKAELEGRLTDYVNRPSVTVVLEEFAPINVSVLGEVGHQGTFPFDPHVTLAQVIATAGGLSEFASRSGIYVVRGGPKPLRVRFTYEGVSRGDPYTATFALQHGDLVVVE